MAYSKIGTGTVIVQNAVTKYGNSATRTAINTFQNLNNYAVQLSIKLTDAYYSPAYKPMIQTGIGYFGSYLPLPPGTVSSYQQLGGILLYNAINNK